MTFYPIFIHQKFLSNWNPWGTKSHWVWRKSIIWMEWKTFQIVSNLWYSSVIALSSVYLSICTILLITLYATTTRVMFVTGTVCILILLTLIKPINAISPKFITCTTLGQMLGFKPKIVLCSISTLSPLLFYIKKKSTKSHLLHFWDPLVDPSVFSLDFPCALIFLSVPTSFSNTCLRFEIQKREVF